MFFTDAQIAGLIPAVPRMLGYQPDSASLTVVSGDWDVVANAHLPPGVDQCLQPLGA